MLCIHLGPPPEEFVWQYAIRTGIPPGQDAHAATVRASAYVTRVEVRGRGHDPRYRGQHAATAWAAARRHEDGRTGRITSPAGLEGARAHRDRRDQDGEPVWFACDVAKQRARRPGWAPPCDYEACAGVDLSMTKAGWWRASRRSRTPCADRRRPGRRRPTTLAFGELLGDRFGDKGLPTMSDSWFDGNCVLVVVRANRLPGCRAALETEAPSCCQLGTQWPGRAAAHVPLGSSPHRGLRR